MFPSAIMRRLAILSGRDPEGMGDLHLSQSAPGIMESYRFKETGNTPTQPKVAPPPEPMPMPPPQPVAIPRPQPAPPPEPPPPPPPPRPISLAGWTFYPGGGPPTRNSDGATQGSNVRR